MEKIKVLVKGEKVAKEYPAGTSLLELSKTFENKTKAPVLLAKVNNDVRELSSAVYSDCTVEFLDFYDADGFRAYQKSACFLLINAVKEVLGRKADVSIDYSIKKNFYCEFHDPSIEVTDELLSAIKGKMQELARQKLAIEKVSMPVEKALHILEDLYMEDKIQLLKYKHSSQVSLYKMGAYYNYFFALMVPDTSCLTNLELVKAYDGFMLQFPSRTDHLAMEPYEPVDKIAQVFREYSSWMRILKIDTVGALNKLISEDKIGEVIRISEALHEKKIAQISDNILSSMPDTKIVLIAGPSSSGKTTFAHRLCVQLRVNGIVPHVISLDNYFKSRSETPLDEFGKKDFESIHAIDLDLFNDHLTRLMAGEEVALPTFNFIEGKKEYKGNTLKLGKNEIIVAEGIHGLNELLTASIPRKNKFKIFISALTQLNIDAHNRIHTTDTRIVRRMVRDHQYRGIDPQTTISMWDSVTRGEAKYIFPYQEEADAMFNSSLVYELSVLKQYIEPLLFKIDTSMSQYAEAKRFIKFFDCFLSVASDEIPNNSIIREFIGGSCFKT